MTRNPAKSISINNCTTLFLKGAAILIFIITNLQLFAENVSPFNIGGGDPSLHIVYNGTNQYVIYLNQPWPVKNSETYSGGYAIDPDQQGYPKQRIILCSSNSPTDGHPHVLYPFDENTAFTCPYGGEWDSDRKQYNYWPRITQVFTTNEGDILISEDVYSLARSRYSLTTNQLFLGKIGTNIYYWQTPDTTKIYCRPVGEKYANKFFKLPKSVIDLYGVTKPYQTNMDVAVWTHRRTPNFMSNLLFPSAPYEVAIFEFKFRNAKPVGNNH